MKKSEERGVTFTLAQIGFRKTKGSSKNKESTRTEELHPVSTSAHITAQLNNLAPRSLPSPLPGDDSSLWEPTMRRSCVAPELAALYLTTICLEQQT